MKRTFIQLIAVFVAIGFVVFNNAFAHEENKSGSFYFVFIGKHGQESDETKWEEVSYKDYANRRCTGVGKSCKIVIKQKQVINGINRPAKIEVDGNGTPVINEIVIEFWMKTNV